MKPAGVIRWENQLCRMLGLDPEADIDGDMVRHVRAAAVAMHNARPEGPVLPEATSEARTAVTMRVGDVDVPQAILDDFPPMEARDEVAGAFALCLAACTRSCQPGRELSLARTKLQEGYLWIAMRRLRPP